MKSIKAAVTGSLVVALTGAGLLIGASSASAATTPAFEPDANSEGSITFYNAAGQVVTSGNNLSHLFDYAVASTAAPRATTKAAITFGFPDHTKPDSSTWFQAQGSTATNYPNTAAPAPINASTFPVATIAPTEGDLASPLGVATLDTTTGYANIVQIRIKDSGPGLPVQNKPFWETDIQFDQAAGTWTQIYPKPITATSTTLTANPNPSTVGDTVTLTATETPAAAGSVQFKDGTNNIGTPVAVSGTGVATTTTSTLAQGSHSLSAVFTPTDTTTYSGSTGTATATVNPAATPTTTALAITGDTTHAGTSATLTATVTGPGTTPNGAGTVAFYDNGSSTAIPGTVTAGPTGTYTLTLASGFSAGSHSVVAKFTPTDVTQFRVSQSAPQAFTTQAAAGSPCAAIPGNATPCSDPQTITANIPTGTLLINTPYTPSSPLDLGTLALSADSTVYSASKEFSNIKVTDTRAGNLPWTVQAQAGNLSDGGSNANSVINSQNVGLTALTVDSVGAGFTGTPTFTNNPAANGVAPTATGTAGLGGGVAHTIATQAHGLGTVTFHGTLTLIAPSSTEAGQFTGTITFTVG